MSTNAASTADTTVTDGITTGGRSTSQATTTGQYATSQEDKTTPAVETIEPASTSKFTSAETLYSESATTANFGLRDFTTKFTFMSAVTATQNAARVEQTTQDESRSPFHSTSGSEDSTTKPTIATTPVELPVDATTTDTTEDVSSRLTTSRFSTILSQFTPGGGTPTQFFPTVHATTPISEASTGEATETRTEITTADRPTSQATAAEQHVTTQEDVTTPGVVIDSTLKASTTKIISTEVSTTQSVATIHRQTTQDKSQSPFHSTSRLEDSTTTPTITTTPVESTVGVTTIDTREDVSTRVTTSGSSTTQTTQSTFTPGGTPSQSFPTMYATPSTYTAATGDATETSGITTADDRSTSQATTTGQYVTTEEHNTTPTVAIDSTLQASRTKISSTEISTAQGVTTSQQTTHDETTSSFHSTTDLQEPSTKQLVTTTPFESTVDVTTTDIGKDASTTPGFSSSPSQFTSRDVPMQSLSTTDKTTVTTATSTALDDTTPQSTQKSDLATTGGKTTSYQTSTGPYVSTDDLKTSTPAVDTTQSVTSTNIPTTEDPYLWHTTKVPPRLYSIMVQSSSPGTAELSIDIDNYDWYHDNNITYEVSYWSKSDANDSVTVTTYSRYITLTNLIANETYSILVAMTYGSLTDTIEMNYTDPCNIHQCLNNGSCSGYVEQYSDGSTDEWWHCDCLDAFVGQYCETELFIIVTLVDVTTTTITVNWTLTDNSYWNRFRGYLAIDLIDSEMAESRSYERYTRLGTTLNRLRPGTSYTVTVTAIERHWHDNFFNTSGSVIVNLPPESPVYADVVYRNASSVYVYWNPGWTDYDTFEVTFVCENGLFESTENVTYPNITLFDLPSNSTCFIDIETISNGLRSETSYQLQINTPQDYCASSPCGINSTHCRSHIDGFACICPSLVNEDEDLTTSSNDPSITTYYNTPAYTLDLRLDVVEYGSRAINVTWDITEHSWYRWLQYNFEVTYESCAVGSLQCRECYSMEIDGLLPGTLYVVHVTAADTLSSQTTSSDLIHVRTVFDREAKRLGVSVNVSHI
ncbi:uncharacterized protein [Ptychodera flava]|uniref:uncharacterized protein n=1 Tax=Ptychodera flava TaxID=63121 RepID=UPI003969FD23